MSTKDWIKQVIKQEEIDKYLVDGEDFINEDLIWDVINKNQSPDKDKVRKILEKSLRIERLEPDEVATLMAVEDEDMWKEMRKVSLQVKQKVYDNRIVFFAPLYCASYCVNNCAYCGFRCENKGEKRVVLPMDQVQQEAAAVIDEGHKRMIVVFGEHDKSDANYMAECISNIYSVKRPTPSGKGFNNIRRVNVNAAPMSIENLKKLWRAGIGTYQVFQETYHKQTYRDVHPENTLKGNYRWRLYACHRAMEAGVDDVAIGALFGLADWRFDLMGLIYHTIDLENQFGVGPHTISFPRLQPAPGSYISEHSEHIVTDEDFKKIVTVLRLAVPYTGLIVTAREEAEIKNEVISYGCTQTDASTKIGVGAYTEAKKQEDNADAVQFMLGDQRSLDEVIKELAEGGYITSFCTAGYRCGRTGDKIMSLLESGVEGKFCKLNAILTFREYLNDYASEETRKVGEALIAKELKAVEEMAFFTDKKLLKTFKLYYDRVANGERDIYM
jgi:2-iminoacetate synthase